MRLELIGYKNRKPTEAGLLRWWVETFTWRPTEAGEREWGAR